MADYQQRVIEEKDDLDEKLQRLIEFKWTRTFEELPLIEQERINMQGHLMTAYSGILGARIADFRRD